MKSFLKTGGLLRRVSPSSVLRAPYAQKASELKKNDFKDVKLVLLFPESQENFDDFKKIITDERIALTSSWIDQWFGLDNLKREIKHTELKLELVSDGGDKDISFEEEAKACAEGKSPTQIAIDRFFSKGKNLDGINRLGPLQDIYSQMSQRAEEDGLGYYKVVGEGGNTLGGCSLAPILGIPVEELQQYSANEGHIDTDISLDKVEKVDTVDVALHLLKPKQGLGGYLLAHLLNKAFTEHGITKVVGTSVKNNMGTLAVCSNHGMRSHEGSDGMRHFFINKEMWEVHSKVTGEEIELQNAASTEYRRGDGGYGR